MTSSSPSVDRIVSVLNFFVEHPQQGFTLTQVVKSLKLSRATTHTILLGFVEAGYLYRLPDKSYILGPVPRAMASNPELHFSPLAVASQEMRALADAYDVIASAVFTVGDEVVIRERAASVNHLGWANWTSSRRYALFPWGSIFIASWPDAEINAKLDQAAPLLSVADRELVQEQIKFARLHGFIASVIPDDERLPNGQQAVGKFVHEFQLSQEYRLQLLMAPVRGAEGQVDFAITLFGFRTPMTGAEVIAASGQLRNACDRISGFVSGRAPSAAGPFELSRGVHSHKIDVAVQHNA